MLKNLADNSFNAAGQARIINCIHDAAATYAINICRTEDDLTCLELLKPNSNAKYDTVITAATQLINGFSLTYNPLSDSGQCGSMGRSRSTGSACQWVVHASG